MSENTVNERIQPALQYLLQRDKCCKVNRLMNFIIDLDLPISDKIDYAFDNIIEGYNNDINIKGIENRFVTILLGFTTSERCKKMKYITVYRMEKNIYRLVCHIHCSYFIYDIIITDSQIIPLYIRRKIMLSDDRIISRIHSFHDYLDFPCTKHFATKHIEEFDDLFNSKFFIYTNDNQNMTNEILEKLSCIKFNNVPHIVSKMRSINVDYMSFLDDKLACKIKIYDNEKAPCKISFTKLYSVTMDTDYGNDLYLISVYSNKSIYRFFFDISSVKFIDVYYRYYANKDVKNNSNLRECLIRFNKEVEIS